MINPKRRTSASRPACSGNDFRVVPKRRSWNVGTGSAAELATYVVEKGKPFLVVVN
jgi:hypothetical protein